MIIRRSRVAATVLGIAVAVLMTAARADAQSTEAETFGPTSAVSRTFSATSFTPRSFTDTHATTPADEARYCVSAPCTLVADVFLPSGARVTKIEVDGCDAGGGIPFQVTLRRHATLGAIPGSDFLAFATSTAGAGCVYTTGTLDTPETIDNQAYNYQLTYHSFNAGSARRLQAVRVFYTLQVSPAPAIATFGDVSTSHPFFQYIEALVASGITAGCGSGNYCPDAPLTRGQMAVFLSKGLGLHFAP